MTATARAPIWYPVRQEQDAVRQVVAEFERVQGRSPDGVWAAPGRVNVIGEHVDYNEGLCLPFALPQRTYLAIGTRTDRRITLHSQHPDADDWTGDLDRIGPGRVQGWAGYPAGVAWALDQDGLAPPGFDAVIDSQVPFGSGLSSSAALTCATALALADLTGSGLGADIAGRRRLAAACVRAENQIAGAATGGLDQAASLQCSAGSALLLDCRDFSFEQVPFDTAAAGLELLVIDTRAEHSLVDGQYESRRSACDRLVSILGVSALRDVAPTGLSTAGALIRRAEPDAARAAELERRLRHVVTEIDRVEGTVALLREGRLAEIGPLLDASHASLRDDYEVSCDELDLACRTALSAGALGARMTGGGFGGSAIALLASGLVEPVAVAVNAAFAASGFAAPAFLRAVPSASAARAG